MKNIVLLLFLALFSTANSQCLEITSIFVDACDGGGHEGENEMFTFDVGATALNASNITVNWPNNNFLGWCQNASTATTTSQLNATITNGCGFILEPTAGLLPANSEVIVITSTNINVAANSFDGLTDTLYIIYQCAGNTPGHFANAGTGTRDLYVTTSGACSSTDIVTYNRSSLFGGDGATAIFDNAGNATYVNNGCNAPVVSYSSNWNISDVCQDYGQINLNTLLSSGATLGGTWTASQGLTSDSIFNPAGLFGPTTITYSIVNSGTCLSNIDSTITFNIDTSQTSSELLQSCDSLYYGGEWYANDTTLNLTFTGPTPFACDSTIVLTIDISQNILDSNYIVSCDSYTFEGVTYISDTILYDTIPSSGSSSGSTCTELFFSEYAEGSSNNKYFEIFNGTGAPVNLANYSVERYNNGTPVGTPSDVVALSGTLNSGDVYVIYNSGAIAAITSAGDLASSLTYYNGDDAIALYHNGIMVDLIGNIGCDPGASWGSGALVTKEATIYRNANYTAGVTTDPTNTSCLFPTLTTTNWIGLAQDDFSNIGVHVSNCSGSVTSGCDTIRITNIKINQSTSSTVNIEACDSTLVMGNWVYSSTTINDTLMSQMAGACDSIINYNVTISNSTTVSNSLNICFGDSAFLAGIWQTTPGVYTDSLISVNSPFCDSLIITTLSISNSPAVNNVMMTSCDSAIFNGVSYFSSQSFNSDSIFNLNSCLVSYSSVNINISNSTAQNYNQTICAGDSIFLSGAWQTTAGVYTDSLISVNSPFCDSLIITTLSIGSYIETTSNESICFNDSVFVGGAWQTTANTYHDTFNLSGGSCDSIHHTILSIDPILTETVNINYCHGSVFNHTLPDGLIVSLPGTYISMVNNTIGCDSSITTIISILNTANSINTFECTNNASNVSLIIDTLYSMEGCDSLYNNIQTYLITPTIINLPDLCTSNTSLVGSNIDTILSNGLCDSIYQVQNTVLTNPFFTQAIDVCTNNPNLANIDTTVVQLSIGGCDSAFLISETVYNAPITMNIGDTSICEGEFVEVFGEIKTEENTYFDTLTNIQGCDSAIQSYELNIDFLPNIFAGSDQNIDAGNTISLTAEGGDTYVWSTNESTETIMVSPTQTSTYFVTGTDANGCENSDSIVITVIAQEVAIKIPTAFTPNGDAINDTFRIANDYDFEEIEMRIYNRWGELIFNSDENVIGWDGTYKNTLQSTDVYIYYIDAIQKSTKEKVSISGAVTLLR